MVFLLELKVVVAVSGKKPLYNIVIYRQENELMVKFTSVNHPEPNCVNIEFLHGHLEFARSWYFNQCYTKKHN